MSYKVETVIPQAASTVGEGPHWDDATQTLLYVDINVGDVHRWDPSTGKDEKIHLDGRVGFVVPRSKGGLVVGLNLDFAAVDWETRTVTTLASVPGEEGNRVNDGKCDASGRVWGGTMMINMQAPEAKGAGNLYSVDLDGTLKKQVEGVTVSNGLAWSGDNKTMFYIDTPTRQVWAYDFDLEKGTMSNQKVAVDFSKIPEFEGQESLPDGMSIDTDDNLWVACVKNSSVCQFDVKTGKLLQKVEIPGASLITSVCWGGKNLDELYVTSIKAAGLVAGEGETQAGSVFRVTGLGAKGRPAYIYQG